MTNSQYKQIMKTTPLQKDIADAKVLKQKINESIMKLNNKVFKKYQILKCVVIPHIKDQSYDLNDPQQYDETYLAEKAMRACNRNLKETKGEHSDDICILTGEKSDTKTSSFNKIPLTGPSSHQGQITGVRSPYGKLKDGALRVIITDPFRSTPHYFYLPKKAWQKMTIAGSGKNNSDPQSSGSISYTYNRKTGLIRKLEQYRVNSFMELANKNG